MKYIDIFICDIFAVMSVKSFHFFHNVHMNGRAKVCVFFLLMRGHPWMTGSWTTVVIITVLNMKTFDVHHHKKR